VGVEPANELAMDDPNRKKDTFAYRGYGVRKDGTVGVHEDGNPVARSVLTDGETIKEYTWSDGTATQEGPDG